MTALPRLPGQADLINGEGCDVPLTGGPLAHPDTGETFTRAGASTPAAIHRAIDVATRLHSGGEWANLPLADRIALLDDLADRLSEVAADLAVADAVDSGVPITVTRMFATGLPDVVRGAVEQARHLDDRRNLSAPGGPVVLLRKPWGPAGVLAPFNAPAFTAVKKAAYALAAGCPVLLKPSPHAPHAANLLAGIMQEIVQAHDAPQALFQLVHGDAAAGALIAADPRVRALTFTGSRSGGCAVAEAASRDLKALEVECGSNNPAIVRSDADVAATAEAVVAGFTKLNGQWCESPGTVFVAAELADQLLDALLDRLSTLNEGSCLDPDVSYGPQANERQRDNVLAAIARLENSGAKVHIASSAADRGPYHVPPTVITGASPEQTVDEIFGPVLTLHPVSGDAEALALANGRAGGLAGYVFTADVEAGLRLGEQLAAGEVKINGTSVLDLHDESAQSFWVGSGIGGHGNAELLSFFLGTRIVGCDAPNLPL